MTPQQLTKNPSRPIIKVKPYQKLDIDEGQSVKGEGESTTSTELSEDSTSDIPTGSTGIQNLLKYLMFQLYSSNQHYSVFNSL